MVETTMSAWDLDMREHRMLLRNVIEHHRNGGGATYAVGEEDDDTVELVLEEKAVYPPVEHLAYKYPPAVVQGASGWIYHSAAFGCLRPHNPLRRMAIGIVEHPVFDPLILLTIMANCTTMAWASPLDAPDTPKQDLLAVLEWVYLYIFTFELVMKMIAYGLIRHQHSYLRDAWCQLDFVVVSLAWLPILFPSLFGNMSAIRSVRALRPLRALKRVPGMPVLVGSILQSLPALGNVAGLMAFVFLVFGIIGMNLFKGVLHLRCADPAVKDLASGGRSLAAAGSAAASLAGRVLKGARVELVSSHPEAEFDSGTFCAADPTICDADGQICYYFEENPDGGTVSFDTTWVAMISILQAITFDTWTDPMFDVMAAYSYSACAYFLGVAILGGMFVVNLFLAVIFDEFMRAQETEEAEKEVTSGLKMFEVDEEAEANLIRAGKRVKGRDSSGKCCDCAPRAGCCGWRVGLRNAMLSDCANNVSTGFVVFNLVIMCMPYAGQPESWGIFVEGLGTFVTWVFIVEMFFKLWGLGCHGYWSDSWNMLDGVIVTLSIVEMLITVLLADTGINISFLRMLRLLRLLRLLKAWPGLYKVVMAFVQAIPQISNLFVLMFLLLFIFALLGMQTFGGTSISEDSRWHFDYFYPSILTVFGIFTGGWVDSFQACAEELGVTTAVAFFVPALVIGFFIVMNLFIAILLEAFSGDEEEEDTEEASDSIAKQLEIAAKPEEQEDDTVESLSDEPLEGTSLCVFPPESGIRLCCRWVAEHSVFDSFIIYLIIASSICLALDVPRLDPDSDLKAQLDYLNLWFTGLFILEMSLKIVAYGFFATPKAYLKNGWNCLDFTIVLISILGLLADLVPAFGRLKALRILRVLRPLRLLQRNPGMKLIISSLIKTLPSVVEVFAVVFVFHIVFAILGMQIFSGSFGACTDESITVRELCVPKPGEPGYESLHEGRQLADIPTLALPPGAAAAQYNLTTRLGLHTAGAAAGLLAPPVPAVPARSPDAELVDGELVDAELVDGELVDGELVDADELSASKLRASRRQLHEWRKLRTSRSGRRSLKGGGGGSSNRDLPTEWLNPAFGSFDDFGSAMLILYVASTADGWEEFMWAGMDATGVDVAPVRNDFSPASAFFLIWMIVGCFVALNLFVGAIVDNFTRIKQESDGSATMTPEQQQWVAALKSTVTNSAMKAVRRPRYDLCKVRSFMYDMVHAELFDVIVIGVIILNVFGMALDYWRVEEDAAFALAYKDSMMFFTYFYYTEFVIKFSAFGFTYFWDSWCRFDFFLVCVSILDQFFLELLMKYLPVPPTVLRVLRVARVLRILRLLKNLKGLRDLVMTLVGAFPALINVGCLLGLVVFMYAVLGLNLFTYVAHGGDISEERNFETFGNACLLLFQCITGDGWSAIMNDAMINEERGCDPNPADGSPSDCGSALALPYFLSFTVIGTFVMLNLVVAVILENFTSLGSVNPDLVSTNDIADYKEVWASFDPDADGKVPAKDLPALVRRLPPPLGVKGTEVGASHMKALRFCLSLGLQAEKGEVAFRATLDALINKNYADKNIDVSGGAADPSASPPAVREVLKLRAAAAITTSAMPPEPGAPMTPRRRELASVFAEKLLSNAIERKRRQWEDHPETHPSHSAAKAAAKARKGEGPAAPTAAVAAPRAAAPPAQRPDPRGNDKGPAARAAARTGGGAPKRGASPRSASPGRRLPDAASLPPPSRAGSAARGRPPSNRVDA